MVADLTLTADIQVRAGDLDVAVQLVVEPGTVVAMLGPNGAGKTTVLRALAGTLAIERGRIALGPTVFDDPQAGIFVPPERRSVGIVFQDLLLFPHLDAGDNVAFGLSRRGRRAARDTAATWLGRVGLADKVTSRPAELSGGEAQRVALARALAREPDLLLLDEPLSALDARTRADVRRDLRRHLADFSGVRLLVTHDAVDARTLADQLVIIEAGRVTQTGTPDDVTTRPRTPYVADLVGTNLYRGAASGTDIRTETGATITSATPATGAVHVVISPAAVALHRHQPDGSPRNVWRGQIVHIDRLGDRVRVRVDGPLSIVADVTAAAVAALDLHEGAEIWAAVKATEVAVDPA